MAHVAPRVSAHHAPVRLGPTVGQSNRGLGAQVPTGGQGPGQALERPVEGAVVRWVAGHLVDQVSLDQLQVVILGEDADLREPVVLCDGEAAEARLRPQQRQVHRWRCHSTALLPEHSGPAFTASLPTAPPAPASARASPSSHTPPPAPPRTAASPAPAPAGTGSSSPPRPGRSPCP